MTPFTHPPKNEGCAHPATRDRATRASHQAAARLDHAASVPCAFTPGPWNVQPDGQIWCDDHPVAEKITTGPWGDEAVDFISGERSLVHHWGTVATEEAKANARLIAAAPDLYSALEHILSGALSLPRFAEAEASAAIAKARGEHS